MLAASPEIAVRLRDLHMGACGSLHSRYPLLGLARSLHQNRRGSPLTFADKPYLIPLYAWGEKLQEANFCKAPQTGITEWLIQKVLYDAGWRDRICAYVMPQYQTSERFVADRLDPLLRAVPAYRARVPGGEFGLQEATSKGNLKRKRFGPRGSLLFLGSNTPADFLEFSADTMVIDEYDACDLGNVAKAWDRVRESPFPQVFRVSNPDLPGVGIHGLWKSGSRARWFHKCPRCGERQPLDWEENIVRKTDAGTWEPRDTERADTKALGDLRPVCRRCHLPWDRTAGGSCWVAEFPDKTASFHISRLDVLETDREPQPVRARYAEWVAAQGDSKRLRAFHVGVLGWPREDIGQRVTVDVLERAETEDPMDVLGGEAYKVQTVVMGVDVGSLLNVTISVLERSDAHHSGYRRRGRWVGVVPQEEDLYRLQEQYHVDVMVLDAAPETRMVSRVRDHFVEKGGCEVWLCRFHPTPRVGVDAFGMTVDWVSRVVTVDRTQLLDTTLDEIRSGARTFPSDVGAVQGFHDQMRAPTRVLDEEKNRVVWTEGNDPDHYRFADAYERVAQEMHDRMGRYYGG